MSLYFVRHGQTDWNAQAKIQGRSDIELNEEGIKQAYQTAALFQNIKIDKIYCSPLKRAKQTAEIINEVCKAEVVVEKELQERCFGEYEGVNVRSLNIYLWSFDTPLCDGAESMDDFFLRVQKVVEKVKNEACEKNVLFVAHGGVFLPVYDYFNRLDRSDNLRKYIPTNCSLTSFSF